MLGRSIRYQPAEPWLVKPLDVRRLAEEFARFAAAGQQACEQAQALAAVLAPLAKSFKELKRQRRRLLRRRRRMSLRHLGYVAPKGSFE